ncbi:MAG: sigma-70 family RNA polymerase sigma factor [Myxococcota bacterium]
MVDAASGAQPVVPTLDEVYRAHVDSVWRLARLLGVRAEHLDDVVHDVFLVVHRRLEGYDPERPLRSWLHGITRNVVHHYRRDHARHLRRLTVVRPPTGGGDDPHERVARAEAAEALLRFLDQLDEPKREVFVLFEVEGMSAKAIAALVGANINTVFTRLRAARKRFERFVAELQPQAEPGGHDD